jgi:tRNA (guanosine-2'-O-)-methyltransferase
MTDPSITKDAHLLEPLLTPERIQRIDEVLAHRTRGLTVVLEDLWDPHNMAAVLRSCDAFGLQDVHSVGGTQGKGRFNPSRKVAAGVLPWLSIHQWADPSPCIESLHKHDYQIAVADPKGTCSLYDIDFTQRVAIVFGNERNGITPQWKEKADILFQIPILGFVESFNISVAAALCIHHGVLQRQTHLPHGSGDLTDSEREILRAKWTYESVRHAPRVLAEMKQRHTEPQETP